MACLQGRLTTRWGDDAPPPEPRVAAEHAGFVAELTATELARIADGDTSLANRTVSWDLLARSVAQDRLLKVPVCPVCARGAATRDGSLNLPWDAR